MGRTWREKGAPRLQPRLSTGPSAACPLSTAAWKGVALTSGRFMGEVVPVLVEWVTGAALGVCTAVVILPPAPRDPGCQCKRLVCLRECACDPRSPAQLTGWRPTFLPAQYLQGRPPKAERWSAGRRSAHPSSAPGRPGCGGGAAVHPGGRGLLRHCSCSLCKPPGALLGQFLGTCTAFPTVAAPACAPPAGTSAPGLRALATPVSCVDREAVAHWASLCVSPTPSDAEHHLGPVRLRVVFGKSVRAGPLPGAQSRACVR